VSWPVDRKAELETGLLIIVLCWAVPVLVVRITRTWIDAKAISDRQMASRFPSSQVGTPPEGLTWEDVKEMICSSDPITRETLERSIEIPDLPPYPTEMIRFR
jgi:hypothetical protein